LKRVLFPTFGAPTIATRGGGATAATYHAAETAFHAIRR